MAFPQASDYRPPIIPDGERYDNPENGKSYYWTQILMPPDSTPETATSIGGYWTVICEAEDSRYVLKTGDLISGELLWYGYKPAADGNPAENLYNGIKIVSRESSTKYIFYANTGANYEKESVRTSLEPTSVDSITNKKYVDERDDLLQREIEILQEEIEAIAPTTDKGIWQDGASATPGEGHFAMRVQGGAITQNYEDSNIDKIIISTAAKDGSVHSFLTESVGDLIQLFDVEDKNYGLFEIAAIDTTSTTEYVSFDVKWLQGLGETHVDDDVLVKTFAPPSGGTASEFVMKVGDTMEGPGPLVIKTKKPSKSFTSPQSNFSHISFVNDNTSGSTRTANVYIAGGTDSKLCVDQSFMVRGGNFSDGNYYGHDGASTTYDPRIFLSKDNGQLRWSTNSKLKWASTGVTEVYLNNSNGDKGQIIKRSRSSTSQPLWQGVVDIGTSSTDRTIGELWYNTNDQVLYLKVS